jgi:hypothetical protein
MDKMYGSRFHGIARGRLSNLNKPTTDIDYLVVDVLFVNVISRVIVVKVDVTVDSFCNQNINHFKDCQWSNSKGGPNQDRQSAVAILHILVVNSLPISLICFLEPKWHVSNHSLYSLWILSTSQRILLHFNPQEHSITFFGELVCQVAPNFSAVFRPQLFVDRMLREQQYVAMDVLTGDSAVQDYEAVGVGALCRGQCDPDICLVSACN